MSLIAGAIYTLNASFPANINGNDWLNIIVFKLCPGYTLTFSLCGENGTPKCTGDPFLRLYDGFNSNQNADNDNGLDILGSPTTCGLCSRFTYKFPLRNDCYIDYRIDKNCQGNPLCSGTLLVFANGE